MHVGSKYFVPKFWNMNVSGVTAENGGK